MTPVMRALILIGVLLAQPAASTEAAGPATFDFDRDAALLDVPYLAQRDALCGGAAAAMVLRYWGDRGVAAKDFSSLVTRVRHAIPGDALANAIDDRGWQVTRYAAAPDAAADARRAWVARELANRRPVLALMAENARVQHYVVVIGVTDGAVIVHDPNRAPFMVIDADDFDRATRDAGDWLAVVTPAAATAAPPATNRTANNSAPTTACATFVAGLTSNGADPDDSALAAATQLCPADPRAWRALANVRFLDYDWSGAAEAGARTVALAPDDAATWRLLATSRYLLNDFTGALDAWNRVGEPRSDLVAVHGTSQIDPDIVVDLTNLEARSRLTPGRLTRASRRVALIPGASETRLTYAPAQSGIASVDVFVKEQSRLPTDWMDIGKIGGKAILTDEIEVDIANLTRRGDVLSGSYRWSAPRRRVVGEYATTMPFLPGVVTLQGLFERQTYRVPLTATDVVEGRRRIGVDVTDWRTSWWRWSAGGSFDRFAGANFLSLDGGVDFRAARDHLAFIATGSVWTPLGDQQRFASGIASMAWRSSTGTPRWLVHGEAGIASATAAAPFAVWPGSHTNNDRGGRLRAHPLREDDIIQGEVFGRRIVFSTATVEQFLLDTPFGRVTLVEFVDVGRAWDRLPGLDTSPLHVDLGIGVRLASSDAGGIIRLEIARGARDGRTHFSAGYIKGWPGR